MKDVPFVMWWAGGGMGGISRQRPTTEQSIENKRYLRCWGLPYLKIKKFCGVLLFGFLVSKLLGFLVSKLHDFKVSKTQRSHITKNMSCLLIGIASISKNFQDFIGGIVGMCWRPSLLKFSKKLISKNSSHKRFEVFLGFVEVSWCLQR